MAKAIDGLRKSAPQVEEEDEKASQAVAVYMGPKYGPFRCDNCAHFSAPHSCEIVEGSIDGAGCCNLFDPKGEEKGEDKY